jgi:hypothetical protein
MIEARTSLNDIEASWRTGLEDFATRRRRHQLYD